MAGGNYDRSNKKSQLNPVVAYSFALQVEASFFLPLRAVRVFTKENEFDFYQEGGLNDYVHMLRKPITKPFTFQVERYIGVDSGFFDLNSGFLDPLSLGTDLVLPLVLYVNRSPAGNWLKNISFTNCARAYIFTGCTVIAKEFGELNAEQSKLHTETVTIAYRELFTLNQISPDWESGEQWEYDGTVKGGGSSHTQNRNKNQKPDMSKWNLPGARINGKPEETPSTDHTGNRSLYDKIAPVSKWNMPGARPKEEAESTDHMENRNFTTPVKPSLWKFPKNGNTPEGDQHTANRAMEMPPAEASKWSFPGAVDAGKSVDHTANRSVNEKAEPSKWSYPGTRDSIKSVEHTQNRSMNTKAEPSVWEYPRSAGEQSGVEHTQNRSTNEKAEPSKWSFPGASDSMRSVDHTQNLSTNTKAEPSVWEYPKSAGEKSGVEHTANRNVNEKAEPSKWNYPGTQDSSASVDHTQNRSVNTKPKVVKWPPDRRALKAQALSDL